jgi:zinc protease
MHTGVDSRRRKRGTSLRVRWLIWGLATLLVWTPRAWSAGQQDDREARVRRATLENGLSVVIVPSSLAPVVNTVINYRVGSNEAPARFPGMAHAQEHMMFRGSQGLSADQLARLAAAMGGMFDADTQQTVTQYFFTVPAEDLDVALHLESIRMRGVLDSEKLWAEERGAIEQEVAQDLSDPEYVAYTQLMAAVFKGTPYAHDALGTRASFKKTTGAMLKRFYDTWYAPNNATLVLVGDVDPQKALAEVTRLFGDIPAKSVPARPDIHLEPVKAETLNLKTDQPYGLILIAFRMPGFESQDYAAAQVLTDVLRSQRSALSALVPAGKALATDFAMHGLPKASLGYAAAEFPQGADASALVKEMQQIVAEAAQQGASADLVEAAKRHALTDAELQKTSVDGLAMAWSQALVVEGRQSPEDDLKAIAQVSVADVHRVAQTYLDLDHAVVAILRPQPSGRPIPSRGLGGKESFTPRQTKGVQLPQWAEGALQRLSIPVSMVHPIVTTLPNGLTLIVQPESISRVVSVYGHVKNNPSLQAPPGREGIDEVLDKLWTFGTTSLDREAFQTALDDIGATASAGADFSLQVLADQFERGVQLLADNELHPALPDAAFKIIQRQLAAAVAGRLQSPDYLGRRALNRALFPKTDPTLRQATPTTIASLTSDDVRGYYSRVFRPDMTTIVVIGQVAPEQARAAIEQYFGAWQATGLKPNTLLPPVPLNTPSTTVVPNASRVQDQVTLAATLGLTRSNPDYYALQLGNHVLGGGFYASRLFRDLREHAGLVYDVSSSFDVDQTRALYVVRYACDPPNVRRARAIVERNLRAMQMTPITSDELQQSQAQLLRSIPLSESSIDRIAHGLLWRSTHDLPLDEPTLAAQRYLQLTAIQVKAAFTKWLRPASLVQVTQGPTPK